ncbi:MAG: ATP synthase subunit I [Desulfobacula sp.]|nr:ATP synthase subunit I [Desulfobacula sp.]
MDIQKRLLKFVTTANWIVFFAVSLLGILFSTPHFAGGIIFGGLIVTVNFHLLSRTLINFFKPPLIASHNVVLVKYYIRFIISGFILFVLISKHLVDPIGLLIGLSVVVASIFMATIFEIKNLIFKEAV